MGEKAGSLTGWNHAYLVLSLLSLPSCSIWPPFKWAACCISKPDFGLIAGHSLSLTQKDPASDPTTQTLHRDICCNHTSLPAMALGKESMDSSSFLHYHSVSTPTIFWDPPLTFLKPHPQFRLGNAMLSSASKASQTVVFLYLKAYSASSLSILLTTGGQGQSQTVRKAFLAVACVCIGKGLLQGPLGLHVEAHLSCQQPPEP